MRRLSRAWTGLLVTLLLLPGLLSADPQRSNRVVFHINSDSPEAQFAALRNLDNHIDAVGTEDLDLKVVLQGGGVTLLLLPESLPRFPDIQHANASPDFKKRVDALRARGVTFLVSGQYLRKHGIDYHRDLYRVSEAEVVDNALSHLSKLQRLGYAYIKP